MSERRKSARQRSFLRGTIYYNNRRNALDCLIRDFSEAGARLTLSETVPTPDKIDLYIPHKEETLRAQVHWRTGTEMGVSFEAATAKAAPQEAELAARVERLEAEIAALKRIVRRLKADAAGDEAA
jgi:hypothetical protein